MLDTGLAWVSNFNRFNLANIILSAVQMSIFLLVFSNLYIFKPSSNKSKYFWMFVHVFGKVVFGLTQLILVGTNMNRSINYDSDLQSLVSKGCIPSEKELLGAQKAARLMKTISITLFLLQVVDFTLFIGYLSCLLKKKNFDEAQIPQSIDAG